jgi:hypothetical protein
MSSQSANDAEEFKPQNTFLSPFSIKELFQILTAKTGCFCYSIKTKIDLKIICWDSFRARFYKKNI